MKRLLFASVLMLAGAFASQEVQAQDKCLTAAEYAQITYDWSDPTTGESGTNVPITTKATNPYQIYELLRTIYCDSRVPGPTQTAYNTDGTERQRDVHYGDQFYSATNATGGNWGTFDASRNGGWMIKANPTETEIAAGYKKVEAPTNDGYTVLMVALKNEHTTATKNYWNPSNSYLSYVFSGNNAKSQLITYINDNIESVELLTDGLRLGSTATLSRGTVYNISGTYNRFFFLSKGQSRKNYYGQYTTAPFLHMFEQFSPTDGTEGSEVTDFYYNLKELRQSYPVQHDCESVIEAEHYFAMAGKSGTEAKPMDGLNFFIPDYRLLQFSRYDSIKWSNPVSYTRYYKEDGRDMNYGNITYTHNNKTYYNQYSTAYSQYAYYNPQHRPQTMLYNIFLTAIRSADVVSENHKYYTVTLEWESSLDKLNGESLHQEFFVYRYKIDPQTGVKSRELLAEVGDTYTQPTHGYKWEYEVPQEVSSYLITYVVTGKPIDEENEENSYKFKTTDSNDASVAIPGTDKLEALTLTIDGRYESDFVIETGKEVNKYNNYISMSQGLGSTKLTANHLNGDRTSGGETTFTLYRYDNTNYVESEEKTGFTDSVKVADLVVTKLYSNGAWQFSWKITYVTSSQRTNPGTYPSTTGSLNNIQDAQQALDFGTLEYCDRFEASTSANEHPSQYSYRVYFDAAAALADMETRGYSNLVDVPVQKTELTIAGSNYTRSDIDSDDDHHLAVNTSTVSMEVLAKDDNILQYEVARGTGNNKPSTDNLVVGAQRLPSGTGYQPIVNRNGEWFEQGDVVNLNGASSVLVPLSDEAPIEGITSYVPIVRTYRYNDSDDGIAKYNTYGAPIQEFALGRIKTIDAVWEGVNNKRGGISEYTWKEEDNDTTFCYYNVTLDVTGEVPEGYEAVGFRAWRVCELAHEYVGYLSMQRYADRQNHARSESKGYMMEWNHDATGGYGTPTNIGVTLGSVEIAAPEGHEEIRGELSSTFGAPMLDGHMGKVGQISKLPLKFRVRMYYKKKTGNQVRRRVDGELDDTSKDYFVVEKDYEIVLSLDNVVTSVAGVNVVREVAGVTYFNTLGQMSMRPFSGVNIVVTRYTDGTTSTGKAVY